MILRHWSLVVASLALVAWMSRRRHGIPSKRRLFSHRGRCDLANAKTKGQRPISDQRLTPRFDDALPLSLHSILTPRIQLTMRSESITGLVRERQIVSPTETSATKREIQVEIPAEEVARETDTLIQKYQKLARIPGFRRGHVPASVIRQRFTEDLKSEVVEALVPRYFRQEASKLGLHPVSQPQVTDLHVHDR